MLTCQKSIEARIKLVGSLEPIVLRQATIWIHTCMYPRFPFRDNVVYIGSDSNLSMQTKKMDFKGSAQYFAKSLQLVHDMETSVNFYTI